MNRSSTCDLVIFFNSGLDGHIAYQVIPHNSWANLIPALKNNNGSQGWEHCG